MIDKLTLAIPPAHIRADFTRTELIQAMQAQRVASPSRTYRNRFDLRPLGIPALFNYSGRFSADHKLEFIGAGRMSYSQWDSALRRIVDDPLSLRLLRVDLAADVPDVSVGWFRRHVFVGGKHVSEEFNKLRQKRRSGEVESLTFGAMPDRFVIYDKVAERRMRYVKLLRGPGANAQTFESKFGHSVDSILTRVERQLALRRVPDSIRTFAELPNAVECRPFEPLRFQAGVSSQLEPIEGEGYSAFAKRFTFESFVNRDGVQAARAMVNRLSGGRAERIISTFSPKEEAISEPDLQAIYVESVKKQLAA